MPAVQREKPRDSIFLGASLWFDDPGAKANVRIRNISAGGMMIDFPQKREKGMPVNADIKGLGLVKGQVAWSTGTRMGIRFNAEVDPDAARVKPAPLAVETNYRKPYIADRRPGLAIR